MHDVYKILRKVLRDKEQNQVLIDTFKEHAFIKDLKITKEEYLQDIASVL
jgi:hypothetical protein